MEQSLESLERVSHAVESGRSIFRAIYFPHFGPPTFYRLEISLKTFEKNDRNLNLSIQERDFYFEKLRDIELMITNIAGEEAETPADPDSELGQMSKKVCYILIHFVKF